MYEIKVLAGILKGETRYAFPRDGVFGSGFIVLDEGDELWYDAEEIEVVDSVVEMDCE